ncbi:MAG TPA: hypothetical protein VIX80_10260 [Candidatus Kapabacteria bacterium]
MKILLAVFLVIVLLSSSVFAQKRFIEDFKPSGEFKLGISLFTAQEIALKNGTAFAVEVPLKIQIEGGEASRDIRSTGTFFLGGSGYLTERWSLGLQVFYGQYDVNTTYTSGNAFGFTNRYFGAMGRVDFRWINDIQWQLYSGVSLGVAAVQSQSVDGDKADQWTYGAQGTPLGVRYGDLFGVFAELGYGNLGIFAIGVNYKF